MKKRYKSGIKKYTKNFGQRQKRKQILQKEYEYQQEMEELEMEKEWNYYIDLLNALEDW